MSLQLKKGEELTSSRVSLQPSQPLVLQIYTSSEPSFGAVDTGPEVWPEEQDPFVWTRLTGYSET